jgi:predicted transcriptional regulator
MSKTPTGHKATSLTIPQPLYDKLKALAEAEDRNISWMIRRAIAEMVERG